MKPPWEGQRKPLTSGIFAEVSQQLGIEEATLRAVWQVESGGAFWDKHGVISRFEPHKLPEPIGTWRDSLKIGRTRRRKMFLDAYSANPEAALRATSWGAAQIMGFNHIHAGYPTARGMVEAMAYSEDNHLRIFAAYVATAGLVTHLRAKNWRAFARGYNGSGQVDVYADKLKEAYLEKTYRKRTGHASEVVLSIGASGAAVKKLQRLLQIKADGQFGAGTKASVVRFQRDQGLESDGVVGAKTWAKLLPQGAADVFGAMPSPPTKNINWLILILDWIVSLFGEKK